MRVTVFQADKGDCLLVESKNKKSRILIDGGMRASYREHVADALGTKPIDLVCVSHIDEDHISGVLQMLDDLVEWRVFDYQKKHNPSAKKTLKFARPPEIRGVWHNGFGELIGTDKDLLDTFSASATVLASSTHPTFAAEGERLADLVASTDQAIQLTRRLGTRQLGIPLNAAFDGKVIETDGPTKLAIGTMKLEIIGPHSADLKKLRAEWKLWLRNHKAKLATIRAKGTTDEKRLDMATGAFVDTFVEEADEFGAALFDESERRAKSVQDNLATAAGKVGDRKRVTTPNLASIMFTITDGGRTGLFTGDGHALDILKGLGIETTGTRHFDVLKVQHHGSEYNATEDFCRRVTADHYVFCGNGAHENPDERVIDMFVKARLADGTNRKLKLWFNASSKVKGGTSKFAHMKKVEKCVAKWIAASKGRLSAKFLAPNESSIVIA